MNGDSNGSFWYRMESTVKAFTANNAPGNRYNFKPRYLEIDVLVPGKAAVAYYYLVGSYTIDGITKSNYRTRVSQVLVTEKGKWKIKAGHFTPLHSGVVYLTRVLCCNRILRGFLFMVCVLDLS